MHPSKAAECLRSWLPAERLDSNKITNNNPMHITVQQWLARQPYTPTTDSDRYYTQLANRVYDLITASPLKDRWSDEAKKAICCDIVGYFADILSETGLWSAFIAQHRRLYGRTLPFFPTEDYYEGEVNRDDVRVLLWYLSSTHETLHEVLSPHDKALIETADRIYTLLEGEYETAPDSPLLQEFCLPELNETDDPEARYRFAEWLFWDSFLLGPSNRSLARQLLHEVHHKPYSDKEKHSKLDEWRRESLCTLPAGPLALFAHEWVSLLWQHTLPEEPEEKKEEEAAGETGESPLAVEDAEPEMESVYLVKGKDTGSNPYEKADHLAYTDSVRYTTEELSWLDSYGLCITRNEIYARHGRMFNDQDIQDYFNRQDWYVAQTASADFDDSVLNEVELYNVELIHSYELQQGY